MIYYIIFTNNKTLYFFRKIFTIFSDESIQI